MYTLNTEDTTRYSLSKCEKSPILACKWEVPPPTPIDPYFGQNAQKMDHFLEAKPYIYLYKTSFLDWKWFLEVSWGQNWAKESIVSLHHYRNLKGSSKNEIWLVQMKKIVKTWLKKWVLTKKTGLIKFQPILTDLYLRICAKYQVVKEFHLPAHIGCKMSLPVYLCSPISPPMSPPMSSMCFLMPLSYVFPSMSFPMWGMGTPVSAIPILWLLFPLLSPDMGT